MPSTGPSTIAARGHHRWWTAALLAALLTACGGGGGGDDTATAQGTASALSVPASRQEAVRFLNQATFGATEAELDRVMAVGYGRWIDDQMALPQTLHRSYWDAEHLALKAANSGAGTREVLDTFYRQAVQGPDQLRQRVAFALSQIFVVSMVDGGVSENPRGVAGYMDMLGTQAFGRYRDLLEQVARAPVMGVYLTHMKNQKENAATGRIPDQNFAREVMQLFSLGLVELNLDGSARGGATYSGDDVAGLSRVFTGWSWDGPDTADGRFWGWDGAMRDPDREWKPMQGYSQFHSISEKRFLGQVVPAQGRADPNASLALALDTLANHPNVGPFIGRQLIQRLVTSHPSPAYVARVAAVFNNNGSGVRGDLKAVVRAVLLDAEARGADPTAGKLREPVLRLTALLRAMGATSDSGKWLVGTTDDAGTQLGQTPMRSPSVFNFYRPGYVPPGTLSGGLGMTVPELQIAHETSVAGYANYLRGGIQSGFGQRGTNYQAPRNDVQIPLDAELALADQPQALVDRVTARLLPGGANDALKAEIRGAVESVALPVLRADGGNQNQVNTAKRNRVQLALFLTAVSPEFLIQ